MNLFEIASRKKYRFPSPKGDLNIEQLWDLPLVARAGSTRDVKADLDTVARAINADIKSMTEDSFVNIKPDPRKGDLEKKLEIVKHVIAVKMQAESDAVKAKDRAEKRSKLLDALAAQEDKEFASMSKEDILKQLAEIDGE